MERKMGGCDVTCHWHEDGLKVEPRYTQAVGGVDHGSTGIILAEVRRGNDVHRQLVWFKGYKTPMCGIRGFGHRYEPARLSVIDRIGITVPGSRLLKGGRLSLGRLGGHATEIDRLLGIEAAHLIDLRRTLVIVINEVATHER